jgi:endogenous inhibitor of DNA gyrase (YacG/DUF329 family)
MPACPICARLVQPREQNGAFPFCSVRCRQVDLGQWLDEKYRISSATAPDAEDAFSLERPEPSETR